MNNNSGTKSLRSPENEQGKSSDIPQIELPTAVQLAQLAAQLGWDDDEQVSPMWALPAAMKLHLQASAYLQKVRADLESVKSENEFKRFIEQYQGGDLLEHWPFYQEKCLTLGKGKERDDVREYLRLGSCDMVKKNFFTWFAAGGKNWRESSNLKIDFTSPKDSSDDATNVNEREYYRFFGPYRCVQYGEDGSIVGKYLRGGEWERMGENGQWCWKIPISYLDGLLEWKQRRKSIGGVKSRQTSGRRKVKKVH